MILISFLIKLLGLTEVTDRWTLNEFSSETVALAGRRSICSQNGATAANEQKESKNFT